MKKNGEKQRKDFELGAKGDYEYWLSRVKKADRAPEHLTSGEYQYWLSKVEKNGCDLKRAPKHLQNDKRIAIAAIKQSYVSYFSASRALQDDEEVLNQHWTARIQANPVNLKHAPGHMKNNKKTVLAAIQLSENGSVLQFASPLLQNDKQVVMTAIRQDGSALQYAGPDPKNDKDVVIAAIESHVWALQYAGQEVKCDKKVVLMAVQHNGLVLEHAPHHLQNNKRIVLAAVKQIGYALQHATERLRNDRDIVSMAVLQRGTALQYAWPELQNDKEIVISAVCKAGWALEFASPELRNDREVVVAAVTKHGDVEGSNHQGLALEFASAELQNDKAVATIAVQNCGKALEYASPELRKDKDVVLVATKQDPDSLKFADRGMRRYRAILIAAGMYDEHHDDAIVRQQQMTSTKRKIVLSTRFSLDPTSYSEATTFTKLLKDDEYIKENFIVYAPNAFDKQTCDLEWTNFDWPCRGTKDTCGYKNILSKTGYATDDCCWRYSYRMQLEEALNSDGLMLQLVETGKENGMVDRAVLGNGQKIEQDMARSMGLKVFHVYRPSMKGMEFHFEFHSVHRAITAIKDWYEGRQNDWSECVVHPRLY